MPKKKTEKVKIEVKPDFDLDLEVEHLKKQEALTIEPVITSITINPNGTIFGLADSKVYLYDDHSKKWNPY